MNSKKKGDKAELEVYKIYKAWGLIVNPAPRTMRMIVNKGKKFYVSQRNDHWGLFDGEARDAMRQYLFQVKSTPQGVSECKTKIEKFDSEYMNEYEIPHVWLRVERKGYVLFEYNGVDWLKEFYNFKGEEIDQFKYS